MPNDNQTEDVTLSQESNTEIEETPELMEEVEPEPEVDYRGKLNATNSFLKKEGYEFKEGKWVKEVKERPIVSTETSNLSSQYSIKDLKALQDVHEDDVETVVNWAKFNKITTAEAKKDSIIQTTLRTREEQRKTAAATNTGSARRSSTKVSDEEIVERASRGEYPEDATVLARAQANLKLKK